MERRTVGSLAAFAGAVLVFISVLFPAWFKRSDEAPSYRDYPAEVRPNNGGEAGTGVRLTALGAVPLCIAVAIAGWRRRVPFLLPALGGTAVGWFGLMTLVFKVEISEVSFNAGVGFLLALLATAIGVVGNVMLAGWSMSTEASEADSR